MGQERPAARALSVPLVFQLARQSDADREHLRVAAQPRAETTLRTQHGAAPRLAVVGPHLAHPESHHGAGARARHRRLLQDDADRRRTVLPDAGPPGGAGQPHHRVPADALPVHRLRLPGGLPRRSSRLPDPSALLHGPQALVARHDAPRAARSLLDRREDGASVHGRGCRPPHHRIRRLAPQSSRGGARAAARRSGRPALDGRSTADHQAIFRHHGHQHGRDALRAPRPVAQRRHRDAWPAVPSDRDRIRRACRAFRRLWPHRRAGARRIGARLPVRCGAGRAWADVGVPAALAAGRRHRRRRAAAAQRPHRAAERRPAGVVQREPDRPAASHSAGPSRRKPWRACRRPPRPTASGCS